MYRKKILSMLLSMLMILSLAVPVMANEVYDDFYYSLQR